jgi:tRNA-Thr(GGU) m(6)t(6)A37 methyltransferase TsaA
LARVNGGSAGLEVDEAFRAGLHGLDRYSHLVLLYWMDEAERGPLIQRPRHAGEPRGVFSIRSPARPNPIALAVARILSVDAEEGRVEVEQLDCRNGTPLLDIKPYYPSIDAVPGARVPD